MTSEEAQELIAEINKLTTKDKIYDNNQVIDSFILSSQVEKIITRFANKPPYLVCLNSQATCYIEIKPHEQYIDTYYFHHLNEDKELDYSLWVTKHELKQLCDNINKMLEWLENNGNNE